MSESLGETTKTLKKKSVKIFQFSYCLRLDENFVNTIAVSSCCCFHQHVLASWFKNQTRTAKRARLFEK